MRLQDYVVDEKIAIVEAMAIIDRNEEGIVYVTRDDKLVGSVSDGDIRRYILKGGDIKTCISEIMNNNPTYLSLGKERLTQQFMREKSIRSVPMLDEDGRIVKLVFEDFVVEEPQNIDIDVVIMAGGKGTRLQPYTNILPKPLMPIGDKTITEHIMDRFASYGCTEFSMIVNYKKEFIKAFFHEHSRYSHIKFFDENEFGGTAGGLRLLKGFCKKTFFMSNCDILIDTNYNAILEKHRRDKNIITLVCAERNMVIPYGIIEALSDGSVCAIKEKPEYSFLTNTGLYVIEPEFLELIPEDTFIHITDVIQRCLENKMRVGIYKIVEEDWLDIGQLEELEKVKEKLGV